MAEDTIFSRILRGEIPCDEVYSDDRASLSVTSHPRHRCMCW